MKLLRYSLILLVALVCHLASFAQEPITVTVSPQQYILPPHLGNYLDEPGDYFTLMLQNNTAQDQYVYMGMQIDRIMPLTDLHVITPPARMPQVPIKVAAGETKALSKIETKSLFNHLAMSDISVSGEVKNGLLPEGTYEACLTAYKYDPSLTSPYPLSNPLTGHCTFQICYLSDAPQFIMPTVDVTSQLDRTGKTQLASTSINKNLTTTINSGTRLTNSTTNIQRGNTLGTNAVLNPIDYGDDLASLSIASLPKEMPLFTWSNPYNNCGLIGNNVTYTLTIKEMMPGQSPYEAMDYGTTIFEQPGITVTQYRLQKNALLRMYDNLVYVAQLTAVSSSKEGSLNFMSFKNEGKSEIKIFRLTSPTPITPTPDEEEDEEKDDSDIMAWMGNVSAKDSINHDSLYTFRTPHLIEPFFLSTEGARKVFMEGSILSKWDRVHFLGGEGLQSDTIQFAYDLQLYDGGSVADMAEALKQQPIFTHRTQNLNDSIPWEEIMDKVQHADYMVLRIKPVALYAKSVAFTEDGPNMVDFAMTRRMTRTLLNCDDYTTISNTTPTTKSVNELKNSTVAIGQYELTLDGNLSGSGGTGFSGTGHVEWNPFGMKVMVAVKFDKLKINTEDVVYEGIAKTYPGNDLPGIESVQEIFSDWGVDNLMADTEIPFAEQLQSIGMDQVSSLAEKYNINTYYTYIKTYGKSLATGDLGNLHLPIRVDDVYNGSPIDIQLEEMQFRPTFATMNLIGEFELPESDALENKTLLLGAPYLCITPDRFLPETGNLCLLGDFKLKDPKSGFDIKFVAPTDLQNPLEGCYVSWKDDAFLALQLHAEMGIPNLMKDVDGEAVESEKPILTVKTTIDDWDHWRAYASMDAFQVEDLPGYTFHPGNIVLDHHLKENDPDMALPKGYDKQKGGINNEVEWQGIYMKDLWVSIPSFIESKSQGGKVTNTEDASGQSKEVEVKVEKSRVTFELNHLYIDLFNDKCDGRFTCKASLNTSRLLTAETNELGGWGISLDEIYFDMIQSTFVEGGFRGKFSIPLLKDKEGNRAKINYRAYIPSSDKAGKRMYCFETSQTDDISMDFFLAEATFDDEQTYFFVEKPEGEDTRVELCMGGSITVSSTIAESETIKKATSIGFKLPDITFSHMRLANCPRWKSKGSDLQAAAYEKWLKDVGQDAETEMSDNESVYFDIGKWSHASPKKKVGGMDFNLQWPSINLTRLAKGQVGLKLGGDLMILDGALSFGLTFNIWANVNWSEKTISYADTNFDEARIKANKLAGFTLEGSLVDNSSFFKAVDNAVNGSSSSSSSSSSGESSDVAGAEEMADYVSSDFESAKQVYEAVSDEVKKLKGFRGDLKFALPGDLFKFKASGAYVETTKTADEKSYEQGKRWNSLQKANADGTARKTSDGTVIHSASEISIDETYTYAFLEIAVGSKALSSIQPIGITELSGGFYMNCKKKDLSKSFSSENVVAQYGMVGGMIGIGLSCVDEHTVTADGDLTVFYDTFHKRLSTIRIKAGLHAVNGSNPKKGLINANATITYEDNDQTKYFEVDVTADLEADMDEALAEFVGSDFVNSLKEFSETSLEEMGEDPGRNTETTQDEKEEKKKKAESTNHLSAGLYINVNFKITWKDKGVEQTNSKGKKQPKWHVYIGQPTPDDKRCRLTLIDFALGKKSDLFAMWATIYADGYLCFGNELPISDLPPIPEEISDYLGITNSNLNQGEKKDLNAEAETGRTKQFSTFKPDGNEGGLMFGAKVYGDMGLNAGIVYARTTAIAGFDVMLLKLKKGTKCIGGGEAGKNGWYGMGQVYALLKGEIGLNIDMWLFTGHIPLIDVGMGALLKAGMPNPSWFYGKAKAHYRLLGGLIKGSTSVQLKAGEVCTPEFGNPLDDIEIFNEVTPGDDNQAAGWNKDNVIEASVYPSFTTNMEMETPLRLLDENKAYSMADFDEELEKYSEQASRTYRFMLSPDSIRLARFNVDQVEAENPDPEFDERVTYTTTNHELFKVASGTLDINKLYRLKLSGYAQEWRDGVWGDPFFNDSTTGYQDKRVKWYQTQYYYFRTDPKAPDFDKEVKIFHTDYTEDLARPTMALARMRKAYEKYDDPDNPVSLRLEVSRNMHTGWESPSKILHNMAEQQKYEDAVAKRNEAYDKAYKEAMAKYEEQMEQYNKIKEEAHTEWVNDMFNPWMDEHYPGWKDWNYVVRVKEYKQEFVMNDDVAIKDPGRFLPNQDQLEFKAELDADLAKEKAQVAELKELILGLLGAKAAGSKKYTDMLDRLDKLGLDKTDHDKFTDILGKLDILSKDQSNIDKVIGYLDALDSRMVDTKSPAYINEVKGFVDGLYANSSFTNVVVAGTAEPAKFVVLDNAAETTTKIVATEPANFKMLEEPSTSTIVNTTVKTDANTLKNLSTLKTGNGPNPDIEIYTDTVTTPKAATAVRKTTSTTTTARRSATTTTTSVTRLTTTTVTNPNIRVVNTTESSQSTNQIVVETVAASADSTKTIVLPGKRSSGTQATVVVDGVIKSTTDQSDDEKMVIAGKRGVTTSDNNVSVGKFQDLVDRITTLNTAKTIYNHYNPAYGDKSVNGPQHIVILVDQNGNEETLIYSFVMEGQPYVDIQNGYVTESQGITSQQWTFLNDKDVPEFFYDDPSNPMPVPPTYGDDNGFNLPDVEAPNYQRDMDSKTFQIPIDEYTYGGVSNDDFVFLRTKNTIDLSILDKVKDLGYTCIRISVNRIHKKAFDDLLNKTDSVIAEYKGHRAEKLDEVMGEQERKGYDSSASMGKGFDENKFIAEDGSMNMDAYLNSYIGELEEGALANDSIALQKIRSNIDMKDFSECLYQKTCFMPTYKNFKEHYNAVSGNIFGKYIRHQLMEVVWNNSPTGATTDSQIVKDKDWLHDPYYALGYWSKWAMIGGAPPIGYSDFPGLQLEFSHSGYRKEAHTKYPTGGHLLEGPDGHEFWAFRSCFMPAMFYNVNRDDYHRYGDTGDTETTENFLTFGKAKHFFRGLLIADCRMAAAVRNAAYQVAAMARISEGNRIYDMEAIYNTIESPHGKTNIVISDEFKYGYMGNSFYETYTFNNKATFLCLNVPIMIYGDYKLWGRTGSTYDNAIKKGTIFGYNGLGVIFEHPEITWRLDRDIADAVVVDNCLREGTYTPSTAASMAERIKSLKIQSYRLNAFHTKDTSEDYVFDVCLKQDSGHHYLLNVGLETVEEPFESEGIEDMNFKVELSN